jgi:chaperone protein EcpD
MRLRNWLAFGFAFWWVLISSLTQTAQAAVTVMGTRVVYNAADRDVTIQLSNAGNTPSLVQTWVDLGDPKAQPQDIDAPFVLSPPMFRIDPNHKQNLRMVFTGKPLPKDRESLYWLNVLEIPPKPGESAGENYLQFSVRSRLKIFYRPANLPGDANAAAKLVKWSYKREGDKGDTIRIVADNPTPYHVSFAEIRLNALPKDKAKGGDDEASQAAAVTAGIGGAVSGMVEPFSKAEFVVTGIPADAKAPLSIRFAAVNDWGGFVPDAADILGAP